ncbi:MAG TPA: Gfo/Idh/MocA family oxidoreductase [Vicinamibacterales bacterium]|nr:Gfo/Idh/MocA family oxidoreductase [Vicinamibacterales bacterium]
MRVAVIGVGHLGRHHARILASTPDVRLTGVVDINGARAQEIASQYDVAAHTDWRAVIGSVDAVTIASPTESHASIAGAFLQEHVHVLVEKPMTTTTAEADELLAVARAHGVVLAVGHTERFNPAVAHVKPLLVSPRFIEVHRLGTFPERSLDIDVVFDLMIHDLDLVLDIVGDQVAALEAVGVPVLTPRVDIANVRLRFDNGCIANLTASRISRDRVRKIRFFQKDAYLSVDYAAQQVEVYRLVAQPGRVPAIEGGKVTIPREEPLKRELEDFVCAIRDGRAPLVTGAQGRAALALAERVAERMEMAK